MTAPKRSVARIVALVLGFAARGGSAATLGVGQRGPDH
jgi:hypothetical protein